MNISFFTTEKQRLADALMQCDRILQQAQKISGKAKLDLLTNALNTLQNVKLSPQSFNLVAQLKQKQSDVFHKLAVSCEEMNRPADAKSFYKQEEQVRREAELIDRFKPEASDHPARSLRSA